jgi:glycosyltransferase involved in cell wall biosynthesis
MLLEQAYANSDQVVFPSQFLQDRLCSVFSAHTSAVVHGPGVIESNPFVEEREFARLQLTKQLDIPLSASIVLGCGNASRRHGFDLFVQLAELVSLRMVDRQVHFVWIGEQPHDAGASYLGRTSKSDLVQHVHSPGDRIHPSLCYAAADVFVLSSREDPFPTACLGAMEAGLPIVAFEGTGGIAEVIGNDAGILVPYLDVHAMSEALEHLLDDAQLSSSLGSHGKKRVEAHFQTRDYARFLLSLLYPAGDLADPGVDIQR